MSDASETNNTTTDETNTGGQTQTQGASDAGAPQGGAKGGDKAAKAADAKGGAATDAGDPPPWYDGLPDDLKGEKSVLRHASLEDAIRAGVGAEKRLGVPHDKLIRLPEKDEDYPAIYKALGAPDTPEGYKIELAKDATDEDKAMAGRFAEHMHKAGPFPPSFVKAALDFVNAENGLATEAMTKAEEAAKAEAETFLKDQLGAAYDPDMKAVGKMLADLKIEGLADELDASGLGSNPRLTLALHKLMEARSEPQTLEAAGDGTKPGLLTRGQARAALQNLEADPIKGAALRDNTHSMHKAVLAERTRLARMAEGIDPDA